MSHVLRVFAIRTAHHSQPQALRNLMYSGKVDPGFVQLGLLIYLYFFVLHNAACLYWIIGTASTEDCLDMFLRAWPICTSLRDEQLIYQYLHALYQVSCTQPHTAAAILPQLRPDTAGVDRTVLVSRVGACTHSTE